MPNGKTLLKQQGMPNSDINQSGDQKKGDITLGLVLIATAIGATFLLRSVKAIGLGDNFDPGPKVFPLGLCSILAFGGIIEIWQGLRSFKIKTRIESTSLETNRNPRSKTVLLLLTYFLIYVVLLPWLGFAVATLIMGTSMMSILGNSWKISVLVSAALIVLIYFLFVVFFKVPLPGGVFNLTF